MIDSLTWSPDGKAIGFLFVENATRSAGALAAMKPWAGVIGEDGVEIQRVGVVDVANGSFSQVTPATLHVYEFGWSPDSKHLVFVAANPPGENNWWVAQLYTEDITGRAAYIDSGHDKGFWIAARTTDCCAAMVARRKPDRLYRRIDERSGIDWRRCLSDSVDRRRAEGCDARSGRISRVYWLG